MSSTLSRRLPLAALLPLLVLAAACSSRSGAPAPVVLPDDAPGAAQRVDDPHSWAEPWDVAVTHLGLDLDVDFAARQLAGTARLDLDNRTAATTLFLDTRDLDVRAVRRDDGEAAHFELGPADPVLGRRLAVAIEPDTEWVEIEYATSPAAAAVQWLDPEQTAGGEHPFLFTQSQAILARTWVPLQDTPSVRFTYDATVRVPPELMALMSAENPTTRSADGVYRFRMPQAIPSYLMALAVGDLEFRSVGRVAGVYAEPAVVERAAWELEETDEMIPAAERLYGPYRWGRYDVLVLPPSFPFGGMENPRLTFATPTILAGDRSLVALVAHELGHSWSGNLVTNATWDDFWLNEGFTVYVERRIMEELRGREYAEMLASLGLRDLRETVAELGADSPDTRLHLELADRDPDEGMTDVAYEKGAFFLRMLEEAVGRERWDPFLRSWFEEHAFESVTTTQFLDYLNDELLAPAGLDPDALQVDAWVFGPGLPSNLPEPSPARFDRVDAARQAWIAGELADALPTADWTTHEWLHFVRGLPEDLSPRQLAELDSAFGFTASGNSEILTAWLLVALANDYEPAYAAAERFLTTMGRRKFLVPLYGALLAAPGGHQRALAIYEQARPGYHSVSRGTIDEMLGWGDREN
ncbi:MAG TPA: M1 family metallopeptidase [Thermoanaerobaculia bacterium]|nr:M1 family metallopeptidase [Thermoanaerobaculia bacterium]